MALRMDLDQEIVEVGQHFTGRLSRDADADGVSSRSKARAVRLSLRYHTEGRGTTDKRAVGSTIFDLPQHGGLNAEFSFAVPYHSPVSYDGSLIRILWSIEARIDLKMAPDPTSYRRVLVVPAGGSGLYDRPHPLPLPVLDF